MKNISMVNVTVVNCTFNGVVISGASGVEVLNCDFTENGSSVVPGPKLQHNLLLTHCSDFSVRDSRLDTSPHGSGIALTKCADGVVSGCEVARNAYFGILITESSDVTLSENFVEGNDRSGIMVEFLHRGSGNIQIANNRIQYNNGHGVESFGSETTLVKNAYIQNRLDEERISRDKHILMDGNEE